MSNIDFSQAVTAEGKATEAAAQRRKLARDTCRRRIIEMVSETKQMNITAAASAGMLSGGQHAGHAAMTGWIGSMRAAWGPLADTQVDLSDDSNWPDAPATLIAFVSEF